MDPEPLMIQYLSEKVVKQLGDHTQAKKILQVAEEQVLYKSERKSNQQNIFNTIKQVLKKDGRVMAAWIFGSYARGTAKQDSDLDLMIQFNNDKKYSLFDLLDLSHLIEMKIQRRVDLVEKGYIKEFASTSALKDSIKIYG
jgi:predicted nucleotidyltransferase